MSKQIPSLLLLAALFPAAAPGALSLTVEEAVALALERNFSIQVARFETPVAEQRVRAAAGAFDPVLNASYTYELEQWRGYTVDRESASARAGIGSELPWGTRWEAALEVNDRTTPFDPLTGSLDDSVAAFAGIIVTQPLLRGAGLAAGLADVRIARSEVGIAREQFRAEVMDIVTATVAACHNLHLARENLRIARRNRDLAHRLLEDNRQRVRSGAMAPLDIVQAESETALREVSVISARAALRNAVNALKGLIWDDPATVLDLEIDMRPPATPDWFEPELSRDLTLALASRPDYRAAGSGLDIRHLELAGLRRNALPQLDLVGAFGRRGQAHALSASVDQAFGPGEDTYSIGAVLSIPFPNRSRSAERTAAYLRRNQAELALTQLEQRIRLELDDAATRLSADWERIQAARTARELAAKSLEAEEKKLRAGTSSTFVVLRLQGDLALAEIREVGAATDYAISLARYHQVRGHTLEAYRIRLN
jgi:outer membrane protein TolC